MPPISIERSEPFLTSSTDWELWFIVIKDIATDGDVWDYVNPSKSDSEIKKLDVPTEPQPDAFGSTDGTEATIPTERHTAWATACQNYSRRTKEYRRQKDTIKEVNKYITTHIAKQYLLLLDDCETTHKKLVKLKEMFCPTNADKELQIEDEYRAIKPFNARRANIDKWATEFEAAYQRATAAKLPIVAGFRAHKDLIRAIKPVEPAYAATLAIRIRQKEINENSEVSADLQFSTLLADFVSYYRTTHTSSTASVNSSAFATATLGGEKQPKSRKRARSPDAHTPEGSECLCEQGVHLWGQCGYVNPDARGKDFDYNAEIDELVKNKINASKRLKVIVKKIQEREKRRRTGQTFSSPAPAASKARTTRSIDLDSKHSSETKSPSAFAIYMPPAVFSTGSYPLQHSFILDPAADIHVCNNADDFTFTRPASEDDYLIAGGSYHQIKAFGKVTINLETPEGPATTTLHDVAYISSFFTNIVSLSRLASNGIHFDSGRNILYQFTNKDSTTTKAIVKLSKHGGHWVLMHRQQPPQKHYPIKQPLKQQSLLHLPLVQESANFQESQLLPESHTSIAY